MKFVTKTEESKSYAFEEGASFGYKENDITTGKEEIEANLKTENNANCKDIGLGCCVIMEPRFSR